MDTQRFDELTRKLATEASRRRFVTGVVGGALSSLLLLVGAAPSSARNCVAAGKRCHRTRPCCGEGSCGPDGVCHPCVPIGEPLSGVCGPETVGQCCRHDNTQGLAKACTEERDICCAHGPLPCTQDTDCCVYPREVCIGGTCHAPISDAALSPAPEVHATRIHTART